MSGPNKMVTKSRSYFVFVCQNSVLSKDKVKVHPRTGHESPVVGVEVGGGGVEV